MFGTIVTVGVVGVVVVGLVGAAIVGTFFFLRNNKQKAALINRTVNTAARDIGTVAGSFQPPKPVSPVAPSTK